MKFNSYILLFCAATFASCGKKLYQKADYPFYTDRVDANANPALKTDGVYILDRIVPNGTTAKAPTDIQFYKFYPGGQSNLFIDTANTIRSDADYIRLVAKDTVQKKRTLFEGYYRTAHQKIVIQGVNIPRHQFDYEYGYLKRDTLIIVKSSHLGNGTFKEKNLSGNYREYYIFKPLKQLTGLVPTW